MNLEHLCTPRSLERHVKAKQHADDILLSRVETASLKNYTVSYAAYSDGYHTVTQPYPPSRVTEINKALGRRRIACILKVHHDVHLMLHEPVLCFPRTLRNSTHVLPVFIYRACIPDLHICDDLPGHQPGSIVTTQMVTNRVTTMHSRDLLTCGWMYSFGQ